jgi:hypothetical protein
MSKASTNKGVPVGKVSGGSIIKTPPAKPTGTGQSKPKKD